MTSFRSLYLMTVDWTRRAEVTRAVYLARKALGLEASHDAAWEAVTRCYNGGQTPVPVSIGNATSEGVLALAKQALDAPGGALVYAVDPTPEQIFINAEASSRSVEGMQTPTREDAERITAGENAEDETFTPEEYETAMLLIVAAKGNPFFALSVAGGLTKTTRSDSYKRVQACILKVFPADSPQAMALVAQVIEDE